MLWGVALARGMEIGAGGVWDSPMATDYWVKRFGFMWGGGSSGMSGLKAMQVTKIKPELNNGDQIKKERRSVHFGSFSLKEISLLLI